MLFLFSKASGIWIEQFSMLINGQSIADVKHIHEHETFQADENARDYATAGGSHISYQYLRLVPLI